MGASLWDHKREGLRIKRVRLRQSKDLNLILCTSNDSLVLAELAGIVESHAPYTLGHPQRGVQH